MSSSSALTTSFNRCVVYGGTVPPDSDGARFRRGGGPLTTETHGALRTVTMTTWSVAVMWWITVGVVTLAGCVEEPATEISSVDGHFDNDVVRTVRQSLSFVPHAPFASTIGPETPSQCFNGGFSHSYPLQYGIDYVYPIGTPVLAVGPGVVEYTHDGCPNGTNSSCFHGIGNVIVVRHANNEYSLYAHLNPGSIRVSSGDTVCTGLQLAESGWSGFGTDPHLHFQFQSTAGGDVRLVDGYRSISFGGWYGPNGTIQSACGALTSYNTARTSCDTTLPTVSISSPSSGATLNRGSTYTLSWAASDSSGVTHVAVGLISASNTSCYNTTAIYTISDSSYVSSMSWTVPSSIATGPYKLKVAVRDGSGNWGCSMRSVSIAGGSSSCHSGSNGGSTYCSESCRCRVGEGDCDSSSECQSGLVCAQDVGARYGFNSTYDVCESPSGSGSCHSGSNGGSAYCSESCRCGVGEGDCDSSSECQSGLVCAQDVGARYGFNSTYDVCESPSGSSSTGGTCSSPLTVSSSGGTYSGTTSGSSAHSGTCGGSNAPEKVYRWTPSSSGTWTISTCGSGYDTLLHIRTSCASTSSEIACNDDTSGCSNNGSSITRSFTAGTTYYIFVDGFGSGSGSYTLSVRR
jgi:hypothetical protein